MTIFSTSSGIVSPLNGTVPVRSSNNTTPSCDSSSAMWRPSVGWLTPCARAAAESEPARATRAIESFVDDLVAVVVHEVADLRRPGVHRRIRVVAVQLVLDEPGRRRVDRRPRSNAEHGEVVGRDVAGRRFAQPDDAHGLLPEQFRAEAAEHLQAINQSLLKLERAPEESLRAKILQDAFRAAHSLKGAARAVSQQDIETLAHTMESVFQQARDAGLALSADICDVLYDGLDAIEHLLSGERVDVEPLQPREDIARLRSQ